MCHCWFVSLIQMSRTLVRKLIMSVPIGVIYLTDKLALQNRKKEGFDVTDTSKHFLILALYSHCGVRMQGQL